MGRYAVVLKIETENVDEIGFQKREEMEWMFKIQCTNCHENHPKTISFFPFEEHYDPNSNVPACNFCVKCKNCKKEMTISLVNKNYPVIECRNI